MPISPHIPLVDTEEEQLVRWVRGESCHVKRDRKPPNDWECCPDFSCCNPSLLQPLEVRETYVISDVHGRGKLLRDFLAALVAFSCPNEKVYIIGG